MNFPKTRLTFYTFKYALGCNALIAGHFYVGIVFT